MTVAHGNGRRSRHRAFSLALGVAIVATIAVVIAVSVAAVRTRRHHGNPATDAFYSAPRVVPRTPGKLLRSEVLNRGVPKNALAWRVLYTTTLDDGIPALASAIVVTSAQSSPLPRPVIAWAHGTTGIAPSCAPSLAPDPFRVGASLSLDRVIEAGWTMVSTDYAGLGTAGPHPYLIGQGEARSVLDAVRAAKQLDGLRLADHTVVWGHSQGGHAALWTGIIAPTYAPDVHIDGVAAVAPASDLLGLIDTLDTFPGGSIFAAYVVDAYSAEYRDVHLGDYIRPAARPFVTQTAKRCLGDPALVASVTPSLATGASLFSALPVGGPLRARVEQNVPSAPIAVPVFIAQGEADTLIVPSVQARYVAARCAAGQPIDYRTYPGRDHVGIVGADSPLIPELMKWTKERFAGEPSGNTCARQ